MDIYLPTQQAGKVKFGDDARIVLDAYPNVSIPAKVSFIATQAQFSPKTVETKDERDKLMFRIRVKIDPALLRSHAEKVRSGLPGIAYVLTDPAVTWPPPTRERHGMTECFTPTCPISRHTRRRCTLLTPDAGGGGAAERESRELPARLRGAHPVPDAPADGLQRFGL